MYNKWYGLDLFYDVCGGIDGREKQFWISWRKNTVSNHHFSREKSCFIGISKSARENEMSQIEAVGTLDETFIECKCSVYNFVQKFKSTGLILTKISRGKSKK